MCLGLDYFPRSPPAILIHVCVGLVMFTASLSLFLTNLSLALLWATAAAAA
jgi:hypothetical protein